MHVKCVLFGFGLGMVFLSAIFLLAYRFENREITINEVMTNEIIIEQAAQLGMIWPESIEDEE